MWVKVCGIRSVAAAQEVIAAAPDAIGLNFYAQSRRCVDRKTAREIVTLLPESITPVGVFVNHSLDEIRDLCDTCGIRTVQLHGDESPDFAGQLSGLEILRAFRVGGEGLEELAQELEQYQQREIPLRGCLIDARVAGAYGGTGTQAPWELLASGWNPAWPPLILAGGLTPENVSAAITTVRPQGVDVASGVESSPGQQDPAAVRTFISRARAAARAVSGAPS